MSYLPRALFFSVPALIVLVGGYYVAPKVSPIEEDVQPGSSYSALIDWPSEKDEDLMRRVAIKQETTLDLLDGRLTLREAVDRFRLLSTPTASGSFESLDDSRFVAQVISFARSHAARDPGRFHATLLQIESATRSKESFPTENALPHNSRNPPES